MMEIFNSIEFQCYNIHLPMEQAINRIIACDTSTFKRNDAYVVLYCVCIRAALQQQLYKLAYGERHKQL